MIDGVDTCLYRFNRGWGAIQVMATYAEIPRTAVHLEADVVIATA